MRLVRRLGLLALLLLSTACASSEPRATSRGHLCEPAEAGLIEVLATVDVAPLSLSSHHRRLIDDAWARIESTCSVSDAARIGAEVLEPWSRRHDPDVSSTTPDGTVPMSGP